MNEEEIRVLVVDDEEYIRKLLQQILSEAGYNAITATNGQEALDKVSQLGVGVVFLDVKMPGMSGMEVLQQLTTRQPDICVIMCTAVGDSETAIKAMKSGAYDYIIKPFKQDDVILRLRKALEKRSLVLDSERQQLALEKKVGEQTQRLEQQFTELVETLAREHKLIYKLGEHQKGGIKSWLSILPKELQEPMSSVEEFSDALLRILKRGALKATPKTSPNNDKGVR